MHCFMLHALFWMVFKGVIRSVDIFTFRLLICPDIGILHEESLWASPTNKKNRSITYKSSRYIDKAISIMKTGKTEIFVVLLILLIDFSRFLCDKISHQTCFECFMFLFVVSSKLLSYARETKIFYQSRAVLFDLVSKCSLYIDKVSQCTVLQCRTLIVSFKVFREYGL